MYGEKRARQIEYKARKQRESLAGVSTAEGKTFSFNRGEKQNRYITNDAEEIKILIEGQIEEKKKLLVPVEENEDIKAIESVLQNIDDEIDAYVKTLDMEESKVDFLIEHTKRITVLENRDIIIELDLVAGAIIAGKDFLLYVHDTMPQHHGPKHLHPSGPQTAPRCCFRDRFSCDQP